MNIFRIIMSLAAAATLSGAWWLSVNGVGGESSDLDRSIRAGSAGNAFTNTSVK